MNIAITGSTGMVGSKLVSHFQSQGHQLHRLVRGETNIEEPSNLIRWDIDSQIIEQDKLEGMDVVIHLAGANVASQRWDKQYKQSIYDSRINSTKLLANALSQLQQKPKVFISTSAIGYYGFEKDEEFTEESLSGNDFLAKVCIDWEKATQKAIDADICTAIMRVGVVFGPGGGAIDKMLPIFKMGLGGPLGNGQQIMSWIALDEFTSIIEHIILNNLSGPINCVTPNPTTNGELTKILGKILKKPAFLPAPAFMIKLLLGEMGKTLLLSSSYVKPAKLSASNYRFKHSDLEAYLNSILM